VGFVVCVGAFMIRLLADVPAEIAAWGLVVGWLDARS
jgi:hypothetical protein